jgi:hypothetical protein
MSISTILSKPITGGSNVFEQIALSSGKPDVESKQLTREVQKYWNCVQQLAVYLHEPTFFVYICFTPRVLRANLGTLFCVLFPMLENNPHIASCGW